MLLRQWRSTCFWVVGGLVQWFFPRRPSFCIGCFVPLLLVRGCRCVRPGVGVPRCLAGQRGGIVISSDIWPWPGIWWALICLVGLCALSIARSWCQLCVAAGGGGGVYAACWFMRLCSLFSLPVSGSSVQERCSFWACPLSCYEYIFLFFCF